MLIKRLTILCLLLLLIPIINAQEVKMGSAPQIEPLEPISEDILLEINQASTRTIQGKATAEDALLLGEYDVQIIKQTPTITSQDSDPIPNLETPRTSDKQILPEQVDSKTIGYSPITLWIVIFLNILLTIYLLYLIKKHIRTGRK